MSDAAPHELATAFLQSIIEGPLLVGDLPEAKCFCRSIVNGISDPTANSSLSLRHFGPFQVSY